VLQMLLNGVGGIVEEARTARRTASQTQAAAAQASAGAVGDGGTMAAAQAAAHTATAAADRAQAATSPPRSLTEGEGAGAVELALASRLWSLVSAGNFDGAYAVWSSTCTTTSDAVRRAAARRVVASVIELHGPQLSAAAVAGGASAQQHAVLRTLAVFGGRLKPTSRAIAELLAPPTSRPPSAASEGRAAEVAFAESQLALALNRSGCQEHDARLGEAERLRETGEVSNARRVLNELLTLVPDWGFPYQRLGKLEVEHGDSQDGARLIRVATEVAPHDVFSWIELGHALRQAGDTRAALSAFKEVQTRHPTMGALRRMRQWLAAAEVNF
jgi:tetratricopeptide (TPR) repeat protein